MKRSLVFVTGLMMTVPSSIAFARDHDIQALSATFSGVATTQKQVGGSVNYELHPHSDGNSEVHGGARLEIGVVDGKGPNKSGLIGHFGAYGKYSEGNGNLVLGDPMFAHANGIHAVWGLNPIFLLSAGKFSGNDALVVTPKVVAIETLGGHSGAGFGGQVHADGTLDSIAPWLRGTVNAIVAQTGSGVFYMGEGTVQARLSKNAAIQGSVEVANYTGLKDLGEPARAGEDKPAVIGKLGVSIQ